MELGAKISEIIAELALDGKAAKLNQCTVMHDLTSFDKG